MILRSKDEFYYRTRSRRPPLDNVNAMLSFAYSLLGNDCASALESVGLDAYVGFMHRDRPGRSSLALDLMEELRPCFADRFVLSLINNRVITPSDFEHTDSGAVLLTDSGRKAFLQACRSASVTSSLIHISKRSCLGGLCRMFRRCFSRGICVMTWMSIRRFCGSEEANACSDNL